MLTNLRDAFRGQSRLPKTVDIRFQKCRDFKIRVSGRSRSLKVVPLDRLAMVFY